MNIKDVDQWICWKLLDGRKIPVNIHGGISGSTYRHDYVSYDDACMAAGRNNLEGPAFCFTEEDDFIGIDLDDCVTEDGWTKQWAQPILAMFRDTYCEVSPSGRGFKIWCRGRKPQSRCQVAIEDGSLEVYDKGRFFCFTGRGAEQDATPQQDALDWLYREYFPQEESRETISIGREAISTSLEQRASYYVDSSDPAAKGQRNNTAFRLAGHLASLEDQDGRRLSSDRLYHHVMTWNMRLQDPLPPQEIQQVVLNATRSGTPRAAKPPELEITAPPEVNLRYLVTELEGRDPKLLPEPSLDLPADLINYPGMLNDFTQWVLRSSLYRQPDLAVAAALSLMSLLTGRKVRDRFGTRTNLYCLGIGPTACGKEAARSCIKELMQAAAALEMVGPEDFGSHAGLMKFVEQRPAILFLLDEIGMLVKTLQDSRQAHLYKISKALLQLYSSSGTHIKGSAYADTSRTPCIIQPHCVVYGTSTPRAFWGGLTIDQIENGLVGRMLIFEGDYEELNTSATMEPPPDLMVQNVRQWIDFLPGEGDEALRAIKPDPQLVETDPDADERLTQQARDIAIKRRQENPQQAAIWSRANEKARKLALILACSRALPGPHLKIEIQDADLAVRLANQQSRLMVHRCLLEVAESDYHRGLLKILRVLKQNGPMTLSQLNRNLKSLDGRKRHAMFQDLIDQGLVEQSSEETGGRPRTIVKYVSRPVD